jgi:tetratricopeptide (TPR) repeat protein
MKALISLFLCLAISFSYAQDAATLIEEGIKFHDNGEYDKAISRYLKAIEVAPQNAIAYYEASFSYHLKKDYDNALKMADKAMLIGSGGTKLMATIAKGSILDDMGKAKEAIRVYEDALKVYPNEYLLLFNYGVTLASVKQYPDAENAYTSALRNKFNHPGSHLHLAKLKTITNEKAAASLAYYFFLLLENSTARAKLATKELTKLMYGDPADSSVNDKTITINSAALGSGKSPSPLGGAEIYFSMMGIASSDIDKSTNSGKRNKPGSSTTRKSTLPCSQSYRKMKQTAQQAIQRKRRRRNSSRNLISIGTTTYLFSSTSTRLSIPKLFAITS